MLKALLDMATTYAGLGTPAGQAIGGDDFIRRSEFDISSFDLSKLIRPLQGLRVGFITKVKILNGREHLPTEVKVSTYSTLGQPPKVMSTSS